MSASAERPRDEQIFGERAFSKSPEERAEPLFPPLALALSEASSSVCPDAQIWTQRISKARAVRLESVRILLVDDSPDNQRLFHRILAAAGAMVVIAENGSCAIDCYDVAPDFDVIVMDIRMPIVDGYEATRQIRARGFRGPIIALTAHANPGEEEKCRAAGCSDFQLKPIDRLSLLSAVERSLNVPAKKSTCAKSEGPDITPTPADSYLVIDPDSTICT